MKRFFWFVIGLLVAGLVVWKGKELLNKATPRGLSEQVTKSSKKASTRLGEFVDDVKSAMVEREDELNEALGRLESDTPMPVRRAGA